MNFRIFVFGLTLPLIFACNEEAATLEETTEESSEVIYHYFGDTISPDDAISGAELIALYEKMQEEDTIETKFAGVIQNVCQKKGCWMNVQLDENTSTFVRFKDYGFFMPFDGAESNAIVNGKAFISITSVDELKHYAEDEGLSQQEIDAITEPKIGYKFLADGVLIED